MENEYLLNEHECYMPFYIPHSNEYSMLHESQSQPVLSPHFNESFVLTSRSTSEHSEQEDGLNYDELLDLETELRYNCGLVSHHSQVYRTVGSVPGPLFFIIYINDIDININNVILKFADDTKIFAAVADTNAIESLRSDLRRLYEWSND